MQDELTTFIQSNPDARESKRAIAVQMYLQGFKHRQIQASLGVSSGFISKWTQCYVERGIEGLKLQYQGSAGYLTPRQRQEVITWLKSKSYWQLSELRDHLEAVYQVVFKSRESYYALFSEAGLSWKKSQKRNSKTDPELVEKKSEKSRIGWQRMPRG